MKYQDFSFYWKIISSSPAVKILFLSFTCEDIGIAMVTNMIRQLKESFPFFNRVFEVFTTNWTSPDPVEQAKHFYFLIGLLILKALVHKPDSFSCWHSLLVRWASNCVLCRNFISIYKKKKKQNFTWPLGDTNFIFSCWKYLSLVRFAHSWSRYFQHSKIKFVSPRGHVTSSIYCRMIYVFLCKVSQP